ncbi:uncharacterized protein LOC126835265 [Adelges cooleyi]|uniref:uncharacterized protein LOC126835265 n=1 Tax=Adelges cooleyi TaxID=133065 RepID=UPI00217F27D1|nr:uncharacterized protein LOC126835265 [Adelges cooleyi]
MHFKTAVILCALYFVTITHSVGVNQDQVKMIVEFVKPHENAIDQIPPEKFEEKFREMGVKDVTGFTYETGTKDGQKVQNVMVFLAKNNKTSDDWKILRLSTYEVTIFLSLFRHHDKIGDDNDGLVNSKEVQNIIKDLSLNENEKNRLAGKFKGDVTINFAEFILGYLDVKPEV